MFTFIKKAIKGGVVTGSYPLEAIAVDPNFRGKPEHNSQQCIGCAACINACPSNALSAETDLAAGQQVWRFNLGRCIFCARCEEVCPTAAIRLTQQYELATWNKADFLQEARFPLCYCRQCSRPFAVQKEIDYASALLEHNGDIHAQTRRPAFETCPNCKRQQSLASSGQIDFSRQMREVS
jgi:formate hydrogenlyase subunit 6